MQSRDTAESALQHVIEQVEFDDAELGQSIAELLALRPDALAGQFGPAPQDDELRTAIAHVLALAGAFLVASQNLDFLAEIRVSGLFDEADPRNLTRFKALALDNALAAGSELYTAKPEFAMHLEAVRGQVREMVAALPGCEDVGFWNYPTTP